jgi:transcriptional regulator with XRE-family HTH domain
MEYTHVSDFALDLRVNRRKAGLSQRDMAHLMDIHPSKVSHLEDGSTMPSVRDVAHFSFIFGKTVEDLMQAFVFEAANDLTERITTLPECSRRWLGRFNRSHTLEQITTRLRALNHRYETA